MIFKQYKLSMVMLVVAPCVATACRSDARPPNAMGATSSQATDGIDMTTATPSDDSSTGSADDSTGIEPQPPIACPEEWRCLEDYDLDGFPVGCDNAQMHANPEQHDMDLDGIGDVVDLCPTVQTLQNIGDTDRDGVGNDCDVCARSPGFYQNAGEGSLSAAFEFRSIPDQRDTDGDGIGDVCDNCITVPNCLDFGVGTAYEVGDVFDVTDPQCQPDANLNFIGDACEGMQAPGSAGPVGFAASDDFDQDGLRNADDTCPRQRVVLGDCVANTCPAGSSCIDGVCGHLDHDGDGVGNVCDNCPYTANLDQTDTDGDFVGDVCETNIWCEDLSDPRRTAFFDVSVGGWCCTTAYRGQTLEDPDGAELPTGALPPLGAGVLTLPQGCSEALAVAGVTEARRVSLEDVASANELLTFACLVPQWDQDFDGIGDSCDLCAFAYDPKNTPFVSQNGMEFPDAGAFCNGEYVCSD